MDLNEFYEEEQTNEIQIVENQLVIAQKMQNKLIELETQRKNIEQAEKDMKKQLEEVMRANNITGYESSDKRLKITLGEDTETETIDKDKLFTEHGDVYREVVKFTPRKGTLRITIRGDKDGE